MQDDALEIFIARSIKRFGDQFNYDDCDYVNAKAKVVLYCTRHSPFEKVLIPPDSHLRASRMGGCKICKADSARNRLKLQRDDINVRLNQASDGRYQVEPGINIPNLRVKNIPIQCNKHNTKFLGNISSLLAGCRGCPDCKREQDRGSSIAIKFQDFLARARNVHAGLYEYDETSYINISSPVTIICRHHGPFKKRAHKHILGSGCKDCKKQIPSEMLIELARNKANQRWRVNSITKSCKKISDCYFEIHCKLHPQIVKTIGYVSLHRAKCPICTGDIRGNHQQALPYYQALINKKIGATIDYVLAVDTQTQNINVTMNCATHGPQILSAKKFLKIASCPICHKNISRSPTMRERRTALARTLNHPCEKHAFELSVLKQQNQSLFLNGRCVVCENKKRHAVALRNKALRERIIANQPNFVAKIRSELQEMYGEHYTYPDLESEAYQMSDSITIFCTKHNCTLPPMNISSHLRPKAGKALGRGCAQCKAELLSRHFRTPYSDAVKICKKYNFRLETPQAEYELRERQDKVNIRCENGHITEKQLDKISNGCSRCIRWVGEAVTLALLSEMFGFALKKHQFRKPLDGRYQMLELDGYNKKHAVAVEYQGPRHFLRKTHKSDADFQGQLTRDEATRTLCKLKEIKLIEVRYFEDWRDFDAVVARLNESVKNAQLEHLIKAKPQRKTHHRELYARQDLSNLRADARKCGFQLLSQSFDGKTKKHSFKCFKCKQVMSWKPTYLYQIKCKSLECKSLHS
ncbi:hypothetical protein CWE13_07420 [Aliidiomarina shirensis]|uniref:Uncharacterized protein n=1 Tax=Aliidiomarina shirensis TaxID=1048642 RepID=A0A432WVH3_9GAMM|nr:hypothetical protein [Aliidiomarina shirensis]RUO37766.1 hypothetical protein CWE13_07420 [Aliidiomarina shirensis]